MVDYLEGYRLYMKYRDKHLNVGTNEQPRKLTCLSLCTRSARVDLFLRIRFTLDPAFVMVLYIWREKTTLCDVRFEVPCSRDAPSPPRSSSSGVQSELGRHLGASPLTGFPKSRVHLRFIRIVENFKPYKMASRSRSRDDDRSPSPRRARTASLSPRRSPSPRSRSRTPSDRQNRRNGARADSRSWSRDRPGARSISRSRSPSPPQSAKVRERGQQEPNKLKELTLSRSSSKS